jgi:thymidine kinase
MFDKILKHIYYNLYKMNNSSSKNCGYLELIIGPMFSGKTSRLVEVYNQCNFCNINVIVINHELDNRYDENLLTTHDKVNIPCIKTDKLMNLYTEHIDLESSLDEFQTIDILKDKYQVLKSEVILINEGQFFPDLCEFVNELLKKDKHIYVCGLDGDFERKKFGNLLDLIPLCDKVTKLTSLCANCKNGTSGIFSMRLSSEKEQTVVGYNNYIPVCRECYKKNM